MVDTSELLRVFGPFQQPKGNTILDVVAEQRDTALMLNRVTAGDSSSETGD
jgi:hypothetical protein